MTSTSWSLPFRRIAVVWLVVQLSLMLAGCTGGHRTRGYILISIDTLRADHLGVYGYGRDTSPHIDRLAARGVVCDHAFAQLPGTLPSHMSIFTGLYPAEHGMYPGVGALSDRIETLPEVFQRAGFATGGFTEGGYVHGSFGFSRGFDDFSDESRKLPTDIERTLGRGIAFLKRLPENRRFFLFLHTYAVHDPYLPPEPYAARYWHDPKPQTLEPTGPNFAAFNRGRLPMPDGAVGYYAALYDATIRYADEVLGRFLDDLETSGFMNDLTLIITADHGEEFREHGKMVHEQIYPEELHVPLIIVSPGLQARRVSAVVQSIDIAPTLYEMAGLRSRRPLSGKSLVPLFNGRLPDSSEAYAENADRLHRTIIRGDCSGAFVQAMRRTYAGETTVWVSNAITFDVTTSPLEFEVRSYHTPRVVAVQCNGQALAPISTGPDEWTPVRFELASGGPPWRMDLTTEGCASPLDLGESNDSRCLSFQLRGIPIERVELYDLASDPLAQTDLSQKLRDTALPLLSRIPLYDRALVAPPVDLPPGGTRDARLKELGYVQ